MNQNKESNEESNKKFNQAYDQADNQEIFLSEVEIFVDCKSRLAEGPCWDDEGKLLYWVDIEGMYLHCFDPELKAEQSIGFEERLGCAILMSDGKLLLGLEKQLAIYDIKAISDDNINTSLETVMRIEDGHTMTRINDGKCDPYGNFWFGTMDMNTKDPIGSLYCLQNIGGRYQLTKIEGIHPTISNGLAWNPECTEFYYIDTPTECVQKFAKEPNKIQIGKPENIISFTDQSGVPDGMTIDEEGMLWIAHWGGGRVTRWNPKTGQCIATLLLPASNVTSCTFGGTELDELYITTAREGLSDAQLNQEPFAGGIFKVKTAVKGYKTNRFKSRYAHNNMS